MFSQRLTRCRLWSQKQQLSAVVVWQYCTVICDFVICAPWVTAPVRLPRGQQAAIHPPSLPRKRGGESYGLAPPPRLAPLSGLTQGRTSGRPDVPPQSRFGYPRILNGTEATYSHHHVLACCCNLARSPSCLPGALPAPLLGYFGNTAQGQKCRSVLTPPQSGSQCVLFSARAFLGQQGSGVAPAEEPRQP